MLRRILSLVFLTISLLCVENAEAVNSELSNTIEGSVEDARNHVKIEYATVALFKKSDKSVVTGAATNIDGEFKLSRIEDGIYYLEISFLGYVNKIINDIVIDPNNKHIDLGIIELSPSAEALKEIEVIADRKSFEYKIDKKVINVGKQFSSASMSAIEVLENVPSVKVDIEGNVSLRGSSGFTVLIDGKPTLMEASDALQQIPANTIENIEIITNPSAKYQPDGTAGIINVITKGNKMLGLNGQISAQGGMYGRKGGELLLNYRTNKVNYYISGDYNYSKHPGNQESERYTIINDTTYNLNSDGESGRQRERWGISGGLDYDLTENDILTIGGRYGYRVGVNSGETSYHTYTLPATVDSFYTSLDERFRDGNFFSVTTNYQHKFKNEGHDLKIQFNYGERVGDEQSKNETLNANSEPVGGSINYELGPGRRTNIRLDYTLPIRKTQKLEAGYQGRYSYGEDNTALDSLDDLTLQYVRLDKYTNATVYKDDISALYAIYSGDLGLFGYQMGLRTEYTDRNITTGNGSEEYSIGEWDYFPTIHASYKFLNEHQLMVSYSRRIERPRGWQLEPFLTWRDAYNVRRGNPDLQPQYIDSYELGYLKEMDVAYISFEGYYRYTKNKIEFLRSVYSNANDVLLSQPQNVGEDFALGLEASFNFTKFQWWESNLMGDIYQYKVKGNLNGVDFSNESFNWGARWNNTFKLPYKSQLQFNFNYNSPSVTAQGRNEGFVMANCAYRIDLFKRKVSAIVQARDIFSTAKRERTVEASSFYSHSMYNRKSPFVSFTISYRINNYKPQKENNQTNNSSNGEGGEEF